MNIQRTTFAVVRHLRRTAAHEWDRLVPDPRKHRGRRFTTSDLLGALWAGVLVAASTLREVEALSERMRRRISDTTLWRTLVGLSPRPLEELLVTEVRRAWRAKEMEALLPFSMIAIDGKTTWVGEHEANSCCQRQEQDGHLRYSMRVLRAVWVSGPCMMAIGQAPIGADQNDMSAFPAFYEKLLRDYGSTELIEVVSLDAGFASRDNANRIDGSRRGYLISLKGPQQELLREAHRLLAHRSVPDAETPWERYRGSRIRRLLFRTDEMAGWNDWDHLRQVWRIRQETERDGELSVEERYYLTNLSSGSTRGDVPLHMVRAHWGIENNCNWTMDLPWQEDSAPWTSAALETVSFLRLLAYNVIVRLRTRRLRSPTNRARSWKNLLTLVEDVLVAVGLARFVEMGLQPEGVAASR